MRKQLEDKWTRSLLLWIFVCSGASLLLSCGAASTAYDVAEGTVCLAYSTTKGLTKAAWWVGKFGFKVVMAPLTWPFTHPEIDSMDGLPPKEAVRQGRVKNAPYVVFGERYVPMTLEEAGRYREEGVASWYGCETLAQEGGRMTANGEAFDPTGLTAAHKYLPLPCYVRVTNLRTRRSIIVRVNDRGPFVKGRIIDLSAGAAKKLGFFDDGTAKVLVETVSSDG